MTEYEFVMSIDCNFPYHDETAWRRAIEVGAEISPNAAFMVLYEICMRGHGVEVPLADLRLMLDVWARRFDHPLVPVLRPVAEMLIERKRWTVAQSLAVMREISPYVNQYGALEIARFACDYEDDSDAERLYDEIVAKWKSESP